MELLDQETYPHKSYDAGFRHHALSTGFFKTALRLVIYIDIEIDKMGERDNPVMSRSRYSVGQEASPTR